MTQESLNFDEINSWPFLEARKILERLNGKLPKKGYVLFETGYGPSGLPHIGTFSEVARTTMVRRAFETISGMPTKLICFSDDMDGFRKVPNNLPNQDMLKIHLGKPLTSVPDPFGECESYGHYMNAKLRSFLDRFSFEYEFQSATEYYKSGKFNSTLLIVLEKYDEIMDLMLPTLGEERQQTYSPFLPICPKTGVVLQVPIISRNLEKGTITYSNTEGEKVEVSVLDGHCKLQWKPDFGARWAALEVDYEMYGKDHMPNAGLYSKICNIVGGKEPVQYFYELFLNETGQKISKSTGNGITIDEWLTYAPLESILLYIYYSPSKAKRLSFDVIPKSVDEYLDYNRKYFKVSTTEEKLNNPLYYIHQGNVPEHEMHGISFSLLLNLASVCNPEDKSILWGFIEKYSSSANPASAPFLDKLVEYAVVYYNEFIKKTKSYRIPNSDEKILLQKLADNIKSLSSSMTAEEIQNSIYSLGMESGIELKEYFKLLYETLLGQSQGPRLGSFIKLYGFNETISLIESKIS